MGKPEKKSIAQHKLEKTEKREQRQHDLEEGFQAREHLQQRIIELAPAKGSNPLADSEGKDEKHWFKNYPISYETQQGLFNAGFMTSTDIQHATMLHGLCGRDVLAAAKTGSGKTLAFLIPVLERLYHSRWNQSDGLGALIITPTRELAVQIFTVLKKIGMKHDFSAGLLIGGKQILDEKESIGRMNILVATPGRLLQHMDETPTFSCDNLRILVLDEADRILEMGFQETMNSIISFLPPNRQSLLFSATQTRSIKDLARLSLKTPEFISDMKEDSYSLPPPERLQQSVMVVPLWEKMNCLWSFLKSHLNSKVVVFLSTGKQIRYVHAVFSKMRVGTKVYSLHGSMNQAKRMAMYSLFEQTPNTVLLATDVAARGLDFPSVDWILQLDCPDTPQTYIHRVGRTARHQSKGKSLLLLTPEEEPGMMASLARHNIQPKRIKMNPSKQLQTGDALASVMAKHPDIKVLALKAFVTYFKFIFMQPDKTVFDVQRLPASLYARSLGLIAVPVINILQNSKSGQESLHELEKYEKETNTAAEKEARLAAHIRKLELEEEGGEKEEGTEKKKTKLQKLLERKNPALSNPLLKGMVKAESDDDDILVPKKGPHLHETLSTQDDTEPIRPLSKSAKRRQKKKAMVQPTTGAHFKFDEDGESTQINSLAPPPDIPPLEWFARVKAETHSHSKGDREDVTTLRRQKKYAAMDRAAERARQGKAVQGEEDEDGEGGEEWEEGGEYDGKYDDDNDNDDNDTEDREREEEEEPEVKAYNKKVTATKKRNNEKFNDELESLDLEEQERLALEILKKRRKA